jgi:hypothetical protein
MPNEVQDKVITAPQLGAALDRISDYFILTNQDMTGASAQAAGAKGMVPAPSAGDNTKFLRGDGTWQSAGGAASITCNHKIEVYNTTTGQYDLVVQAVTV